MRAISSLSKRSKSQSKVLELSLEERHVIPSLWESKKNRLDDENLPLLVQSQGSSWEGSRA